MPESDDPLLTLVARIVSAQVEHNDTPAEALPGLIRDVYQALANVETNAAVRTRPIPPADRDKSASQTVFDDYLICMECGLHMKMLKRHLLTVHNATPAHYREKWSLSGDYPMVARRYAQLSGRVLPRRAVSANARRHATVNPPNWTGTHRLRTG